MAPTRPVPTAVPGTAYRTAHRSIAALFVLLGFQYATWASRLPALKERLGLDEAQLGLLLTGCGIGAAASFPLVPLLTARLGTRRLALLSAAALALVLPALAVAPGYPTALAAVCADGVAVGCLNVAMNAQGAALEAAHGRTAMAGFHAAFTAGSLAAALLASAAHLLTPSLTVHFATAGLLLLLLLAATARGLPADPARPADAPDDAAVRAPGDAPGTRRDRAGGRAVPAALSRVTLWTGCAMVFGTVTEGAMNDWSALYLRDAAGAAPQTAPLGIAAVSVVMLAARLRADTWRARWGDAAVMRAGSLLAAAGLAAALLAGGVVPALAGFACVGLGMAAVTPCCYVAAARQGPRALSLVAAMGTTGLLAGPAAIGFVADARGITWGMAAVALAALLTALCGTRIPLPAGART